MRKVDVEIPNKMPEIIYIKLNKFDENKESPQLKRIRESYGIAPGILPIFPVSERAKNIALGRIKKSLLRSLSFLSFRLSPSRSIKFKVTFFFFSKHAVSTQLSLQNSALFAGQKPLPR